MAAGGKAERLGSRSALISSIGLLCLVMYSGNGNAVGGGVSLQKIAYFCRYLGWPLCDYTLHYCGPYSQTLAETLADARSSGPVSQGGGEARRFRLTDAGRGAPDLFVKRAFDPDGVGRTRRLARPLSGRTRTGLEIAATVDYVASGPGMKKAGLLGKVRPIKPSHRKDRAARAHAAWKKLVRGMDIPAELAR